MAAKVHVISQLDTGVVLAACTRGEGGTQADILSQLVGAAFPLTAPAKTQPNMPATIGGIDAASLAVDAIPFELSSNEAQDVLQNPTTYGVVRDSTNNFQKVSKVGTLNNLTLTTTGITFTVVTNLPVAPKPNVWIQLFNTQTQKVKTPPGLSVQSNVLTPQSGSIGFTVDPGTYNVAVLVQGYAAFLQAEMTVS